MLVVVPTRDKVTILSKCIESILRQKSDFKIQILVVDNRSVEPQTHLYLSGLASSIVGTITFDHKFNFSKICNVALASSDWDVACLINNDVELSDNDTLQKLCETALMSDVGLVGAVLRYPETEAIQHAGIALKGFRIGKNMISTPTENQSNPQYRISAVTFALAALSRSSYETIGNLDESFAVGWNDVDYGVRAVKANLKNIIRSDVVAYHHESATRGKSWNILKIFRAVYETIVYLRKHGVIKD